MAAVCQAEATYNSLKFAWHKVEGVNQYGYTLTDATGTTVDEGTTDQTSVTFADLTPATDYTFELRVYGAVGEPSYRTSISAATLAIVSLDVPEPVVEQVGNKIKLSWPAISGAASYRYCYDIGDDTFSIDTADTECYITGLAPGIHEVTLQAISDYGGYTDSEVASVECVRSRTEIATVTGTYTSGLIRRNNSWSCQMHIYDDDTFTIDSFYQGEGYNLEIYLDRDETTSENFLGIYSFVEFPQAQYYIVDTGRASVPQIEMIPGLVDGAYGSTFTGDATSGTLTINTRYSTSTGTDKFVW